MRARFVTSVCFTSALFLGVGGLSAVMNHVSESTSGSVHVAQHGESVTRTETASYYYERSDNTGSVRTDDGNVWLINNPRIRHNGSVTVSFDDMGTKSVKDDRIVSVVED